MSSVLSLMPPSSVEPSSLRLPPALVGVMRIHSNQLRAEQPRFVAARAGADFENRVFLIVRILWQQRDARFVDAFVDFFVQLVDFRARKLRHVGIGEHFLCVLQIARELFEAHSDVVQLAQFAVLAHQAGKQRCVRDDLRQRDSNGKLLVAPLDRFELTRDSLALVEAGFLHITHSLPKRRAERRSNR